VEDVEPLLAHATAAALSEAHQIIGCGWLVSCAAVVAESNIAASSSSLLFSCPSGFAEEMS
jgi:hypothetical protein